MTQPPLDPKLTKTIRQLEARLADEKRQRIANARSAAAWRRSAQALRCSWTASRSRRTDTPPADCQPHNRCAAWRALETRCAMSDRQQCSPLPEYLSQLPATLPPGIVLVHDRGRARWWLQPPAVTLTTCPCGKVWHLGDHFRKVQPRRFARGVPSLPPLPSLSAS
jgi:hypothetical protein